MFVESYTNYTSIYILYIYITYLQNVLICTHLDLYVHFILNLSLLPLCKHFPQLNHIWMWNVRLILQMLCFYERYMPVLLLLSFVIKLWQFNLLFSLAQVKCNVKWLPSSVFPNKDNCFWWIIKLWLSSSDLWRNSIRFILSCLCVYVCEPSHILKCNFS